MSAAEDTMRKVVYTRLAEIALIVHSLSMIVTVVATPSGSNKIHFSSGSFIRMPSIEKKAITGW